MTITLANSPQFSFFIKLEPKAGVAKSRYWVRECHTMDSGNHILSMSNKAEHLNLLKYT